MDVDITVKNYRVFTDEAPARFSIRNGFTSFIGLNNSGKSSLLRFFYEFRELFNGLSSFYLIFLESLNGPVSFSPKVSDAEEVFAVANERDLVIYFDFRDAELRPLTAPPPVRLMVTLNHRGQLVTDAFLSNGKISRSPHQRFLSEESTLLGPGPLAKMAPVFEFFKLLGNAIYIGPFRNVVNLGSSESYFDMKIGLAFVQQWRTMKTGFTKRLNQIAIQVAEDVKRIFDLSSLDVSAMENSSTLQLLLTGSLSGFPKQDQDLHNFQWFWQLLRWLRELMC